MAENIKIEEIDRNFVTDSTFDASGLKFYNVLEAPFRVYGLILPSEENSCFLRLPKEIADNTNPGVANLNYHTSGGRVRFRTNSSKIAIIATLNHISRMSHFAFSSSAGFDLYINGEYESSFIPSKSVEDKFASLKRLDGGEMMEVQINFPQYAGVDELIIGLDEGATVEEGKKYDYDKPIVYYGSSITQGACATRPGNSFPAMIERETNCDYINLGFSGNGRCEPIIAEYIAGLDMQLFLMDDVYYVTPTAAELVEIHEPFFKKIREKNPNLPIIMTTSDNKIRNAEERRRVIKRTYDNAVASGDKNVYLVNTTEVMRSLAGGDGTVDGIHPNDLGFRGIANGYGKIIKEVLEKGK